MGLPPEERARYAAQLEQDWAWEADMRHMCPNADEELARWWGERCRAATSPGAARALIEMDSLVDVRDTLGAVQAPTLVLHRRDDVDSHVEEGRYLADRIPGARFVELDGTDHFVGVDPDQILDPVEEFVRALESSAPTESSLTTLLAVHVEEPIDPAWVRGILQAVLERVPRRTRRRRAHERAGHVRRPGAGGALRRWRSSSAPRPPACTSRSGCTPPRSPGGARRSPATAWPSRRTSPIALRRGEVWVTSTLRDLTAGSGLSFEPRDQLDGPLARPHRSSSMR